MRTSRSKLAGTLVVLAALLTGCWEVRERPSPPDLSGQNSEIEQTAQRLMRLEDSMSAELEALRQARAAFFEESPQAWGEPFPLDTFKHAAMSCLNEPPAEAEPEPHLVEVAQRLGVTCVVAAGAVLDEALEDVPEVRPYGVKKFRQVDDLRLVRAQLQARLRQLPAIAQRTRNYLATRRAEARQFEADTERKRSEYSRKDYEETMRRLAQYRGQLDALDVAIREVEESVPRWSREIGNVVDELYKDLSRLGRG